MSAGFPDLRRHWRLDPALRFLNHGSYGACPGAVLDEQARLRAEMESNPVRFLARELEPRLERARSALGAFVGAASSDLVFVTNATAGVNAVLRSLALSPGDEILITDHAYEACATAAHYVAGRSGARVVVAKVPFPLESGAQVIEAVLRAAGPRVRLALLDHVTSSTALVWPVAEIITALEQRGIDTLVDGAHAPGMVPLDIAALAPAYYAGNCHKWLCAPKGSGFLYVRPDRQAQIAPVAVSRFRSPATREESFRARFDWTGTYDPTAVLCVPVALEYLPSLVPGGWPSIMAANHALALRGREILHRRLGLETSIPDDMLGSMAAVPLGDAAALAAGEEDRLSELLRRDGFEVPVIGWGDPGLRICRISAHLYNVEREFQELAACLFMLSGRQ